MKQLHLLGIALIAAMFCGCNMNFNLESMVDIVGSGIAETETREVAEFDSIEVDWIGKYIVEQSDVTEVTVTADDNILPSVLTEVSGSELTIRCSESVSIKSDTVIRIRTPNLSSIKIDGVATLALSNVESESLSIEVEGAASISGTGKVTELELDLDGASSANLSELVAKNVDIQVDGAGKASINATGKVKAGIDGIGKITIYGKPEDIQKDIDGFGKIVTADE